MRMISPNNYFNKVREGAISRIKRLSESKKNALKENLEHGLANLAKREEMDMYLSEYGDIHQEKLLLAFNELPRKILSESKISVIDYGCGQGVASMVMCDVFQSIVDHPYLISDFHLIEPSRPCLMIAVEFLHKYNPEARIVYFNNPCEDIWRLDIQPKSEVVVHLFSNVIDMPDFPRKSVANKLNDMTDFYNVVVCVSPFYQENGRARHMDEFGAMLPNFKCHHSCERHTDDWNKPFSYQSRIFVNSYY